MTINFSKVKKTYYFSYTYWSMGNTYLNNHWCINAQVNALMHCKLTSCTEDEKSGKNKFTSYSDRIFRKLDNLSSLPGKTFQGKSRNWNIMILRISIYSIIIYPAHGREYPQLRHLCIYATCATTQLFLKLRPSKMSLNPIWIHSSRHSIHKRYIRVGIRSIKDTFESAFVL